MFAAAFRLLALAALIFMPLGMGAGPVRAEVPAAHAMTGDVGSDHCGDQQSGKSGKVPSLHCGGTCSALPQVVPAAPDTIEVAAVLPPTGKVEPMSGTAPVPSTPPPRIS